MPAKSASPLPSARAGRAVSPVPADDDGEDIDASQRVMVAVRIRPHNQADGDVRDRAVRRAEDRKASIVADPVTHGNRPRSFAYDFVFDDAHDQAAVFEQVGKSFLEDCFAGYNCTIFAYGQTGSGKTYSMFGHQDLFEGSSRQREQVDKAQYGVLPRLVTAIMDECENRQKELTSLTCKVQVSFLEIYNEKVRDLLSVGKTVRPEDVQSGKVELPEIKLVEDRKTRRWYSKELKQVTVMSLNAVLDLIMEGNRFRQRSSTDMNAVSSRSHSVFTLTLKQTHDPPSVQHRDKESRFTFIDLAGSERQSKTGIVDQRLLREAEQINLSLFTLGRCFNAFTSGGGARVHVPVRDSMLTRLLADIFGGNSKTLMFAAVSPSSANLGESHSTLVYAAGAKKIKHSAKVNTMAKQLELQELKEQLEALGKLLLEEKAKTKHQRESDQRQIRHLQDEKQELQRQVDEVCDQTATLEAQCVELEEENARLRGGGKVPGLNLGRLPSKRGAPAAGRAPEGGAADARGPQRQAAARVGDAAASGSMDSSQAAGSVSARVQLGGSSDDDSSDSEEQMWERDEKLRMVHQELTAKLTQLRPGMGGSAPPTARGGQATARSYMDPVDSARFGARPDTVRSLAGARTAELRNFAGHGAAVYSCAFSPDGLRVMSVSRDRTAKVWNTNTGEELFTMKGHHGFALNCDFSPKGDMVVSASEDRTVRIWDAATGRKLHSLRGHQDKVYSSQFSPSGREVVSASCDRSVKVWSTADGKKIVTLRGHSNAVFCASFSRDGQRIASASDDRTIRLWRWQTQQEIGVLKGHSGVVWSVRWHPDGKHLVSASMDMQVRIWSADQMATVRVFKGHGAPVHHAIFARDGQLIVSASRDRTLRVWNVEDGRCLQTLVGHGNTVYHCAVHGNVVLSCSSDDLLKIWKITV
eukprot:TRINITY_DN489_c1_g2_i1.p1 TRINITY_DN489_c1_g2~~TRINITY_DN489_c1_g2_i1.p1  ORF type:complete len:925 (+),score=285.14 TRINITY_DN489_c1_g2_i1:76-2850(+)